MTTASNRSLVCAFGLFIWVVTIAQPASGQVEVTGQWDGTTTISLVGVRSPMAVTFMQSGSSVTGRMSGGFLDMPPSTINGSITGSAIAFKTTGNPGEAGAVFVHDFRGTIGGNSITGTFQILLEGIQVYDGTFSLGRSSPPPVTLTSLSPSSATVGSPGFTLTATGSGFATNAVIRWNGANRTTAFISSTQLRAAIPAADISAEGSAQVSILNPSTGLSSNALSFTITRGANPAVTSGITLTPGPAYQVGQTLTGRFTVTNRGGSSITFSVLALGGRDPDNAVADFPFQRNITLNPGASYAYQGTLTLNKNGTYRFFVAYSTPDGVWHTDIPAEGGTKNSLDITVIANPPPALSSLSPSSTIAGSSPITLAVHGANFTTGATVFFNGVGLPTQFVSTNQLRATLSNLQIATPGIASVSVSQGGVTSSAKPFEIWTPITTSSRYYFAQISAADVWRMSFIYVNPAAQPVTCDTYFYSDTGTPLSLTFQGSSLTARRDAIPAGGTLHAVTDAAPQIPVLTGWARADCSGPVKASALFRKYEGNRATAEGGVIAMTAPASQFATFATDATGIAYANPSTTQNATVTFTARDTGGATLASRAISLAPGQHGSAQLVSLLGVGAFRGSLNISSTVPIITLALNVEESPLFSALPPGQLDLQRSGPQKYYFPQVAAADVWRMEFIYVNPGANLVTCDTAFYSDAGTPLGLTFSGVTMTRRSDAVPAGGTLYAITDASPQTPVLTGWAQTECSGPVKASALFRKYEGGTATAEGGVIAMAAPANQFATFATELTGVAYGNPSSAATTTVTFTARNTSGAIIASKAISLAPGQHGSAQLVSLLGVGGFRGSLTIVSSIPIISLSLNVEESPLFSALPPGQDEDAGESSCFRLPLDTAENWGVPFNYFGHYFSSLGGYHPGEDWNLLGSNPNADLGKPVYAVAEGRVAKVSDLGTLGWLVALEHTGSFTIPAKSGTENGQFYSYPSESVTKVYSVYIHISSITVLPGTSVSKNTILGYIIDPGGGPHLHLEIRHPNTLHSGNWSLFGPQDNWAYVNGAPTGYYLSLQRMVDAGARDPREFMAVNSNCNDLPALLIDGTSSSTHTQLQTFTFSGSNYTASRSVTRYVRPSAGGTELSLGPVTADGSGKISWTFTPDCAYPIGTYLVRAVDDATSRSSNSVTEIVTSNSSCSVSNPNPTGTWTGTWNPTEKTCGPAPYPSQSLTLNLTQVASTITGTLSGPGIWTGALSGQITGDKLTLNIDYHQNPPDGLLTATISGNMLAGFIEEFPRPPACTWKGPFSLTRQGGTGALPNLLIDGSTSRTRQQLETFTFTGSNYTLNGSVARYVRQSSSSTAVLLSPQLFADSAGNIRWTFTPECSYSPGTYFLWAVDSTSSRVSNTVTEVVTLAAPCPTQNPTITNFTPTSGLVGSLVTINGTNFNSIAAGNTVRFNGVSAGINSATATMIVATVPTGATTGPISVTTALGTGTSSTNFSVTSVGNLSGRWETKYDWTFSSCPIGPGFCTRCITPHLYTVSQSGSSITGSSSDTQAAQISGSVNGSSVNLTLRESFSGLCTRTFTLSGTLAGPRITGTATGGDDNCGTCRVNGTFEINVLPSGAGLLFGAIADAAGDASVHPSVAVSPDLLYASSTVSAGVLTLKVRYAPGTYNPQTTWTLFWLDTDQNASTGHPGTDGGGVNDAGVIGSEYVIYLDPASGNQVARYNGCVNCFVPAGSVQVSVVSDGMDVSVPLPLLGNDDGRLNFKVSCATRLPGGSSTFILDYLSNVGVSPGRTLPP